VSGELQPQRPRKTLFAVYAEVEASTHRVFNFVPLGELDQALDVDETRALSAAGASAQEL